MDEEIICEYKNRCTRHPDWCKTCLRNTGKRDYYKPSPCPTPYYPWVWWYWQYPNTYPEITCTATISSGNSEQKDYYSTNVNNTY